MTVHKIAHCKVMKGNGPAFKEKIVEVFFDDVPEGTCEAEILYMVTNEIRFQLKGFTHHIIEEIQNA